MSCSPPSCRIRRRASCSRRSCARSIGIIGCLPLSLEKGAPNPPGVPGRRSLHCQTARERDAGDQLILSLDAGRPASSHGGFSSGSAPRFRLLVRPCRPEGGVKWPRHSPVVVRDGRSLGASRCASRRPPSLAAIRTPEPQGHRLALTPPTPPPLRQPAPVYTAAPSVEG